MAETFYGDLASEDTWRKNAACRKMDPNYFFPTGRKAEIEAQVAAAKEICISCASQIACLDYALANNIGDGVWGGATEKERKVILKGRSSQTSA